MSKVPMIQMMRFSHATFPTDTSHIFVFRSLSLPSFLPRFVLQSILRFCRLITQLGRSPVLSLACRLASRIVAEVVNNFNTCCYINLRKVTQYK